MRASTPSTTRCGGSRPPAATAFDWTPSSTSSCPGSLIYARRARATCRQPIERVWVAMAILMTNEGVPLIYYGDEVGQAGAGDPDNRRPMQWSGYSAGQQQLLGRRKKLGTVRAAHPALRDGTR